MYLLRDKNLVSFISEGYFYIADMSQGFERFKVKLNIRIPNEAIKNFDVDFNMTTLILSTNSGKIYLYDLPKAFENERVLSKRRTEIGVDSNLVYTYLERFTPDNYSDLKSHTTSFNAG